MTSLTTSSTWSLIADRGTVPALCDIPYHSLRLLFKQGYLDRVTQNGKVWYGINEKGIGKIKEKI